MPSMVVLTHGHLDHAAAIPGLFALLGKELPIAIHPEDAHYLGEESERTNRELFEAIGAPSYFHSFWKPLPKATVLLSEGMTVPGTSLQVIHTPGHSRGSICLYEAVLNAGSYGVEEGSKKAGAEHYSGWSCLISGDTLFRDGVGRTDAPDSDLVLLIIDGVSDHRHVIELCAKDRTVRDGVPRAARHPGLDRPQDGSGDVVYLEMLQVDLTEPAGWSRTRVLGACVEPASTSLPWIA